MLLLGPPDGARNSALSLPERRSGPVHSSDAPDCDRGTSADYKRDAQIYPTREGRADRRTSRQIGTAIKNEAVLVEQLLVPGRRKFDCGGRGDLRDNVVRARRERLGQLTDRPDPRA